MKTIKVEIQLLELHELNAEGREKAINDHFDFMCSLGTICEDKDGYSYTDYSDPEEKEIIESIEANEYLFFKDGSIANTINFRGKHERTGETVFLFQDQEFIL